MSGAPDGPGYLDLELVETGLRGLMRDFKSLAEVRTILRRLRQR